MKTSELNRYLQNWQKSEAPGAVRDLKVEVSVHERDPKDKSPFGQAFATTWIYWTQANEIYVGKRYVHVVAFFGDETPGEEVSNDLAYRYFRDLMESSEEPVKNMYMTPDGMLHYTHPYRK